MTSRFEKLHQNIRLSPSQRATGEAAAARIIAPLNAHFYPDTTPPAPRLVGSWGKDTCIRPPRDVDIVFALPPALFRDIQHLSGNIQSRLLQNIKAILATPFPHTELKGDGPIVSVGFSDCHVDLIPAFARGDGRYFIPITRRGGHFKITDYDAELREIDECDRLTNGLARALIRILKRWQAHIELPLSSFALERLVIEFLVAHAQYNSRQILGNMLICDVLRYIESRAGGLTTLPGTRDTLALGTRWYPKVKSTRERAEQATRLDREAPLIAGRLWQRLFGTDIPLT